jgi:hypothetical protein
VPREGTPEFYREEASRSRELAAGADSPLLRHRLLGLADEFDRMARHAERRREVEQART